MSALALILLILAVAAAVAVGFLWWRERRRAELLEEELARERAKPQGRALAPPPLKAVLQTASRVREQGLGEALWSSFEELAGWAEDAEPELRQLAARDGTLTILFTDIEDSTALNEELGDKAWLKVLGAHDKIVRRCAAGNGGRIVKSQGDGFMIAFAAAEEAIRSAVEVQRALGSRPRRLRAAAIAVRIGVHTGPALEKGGDLFGRNVALAARVADRASGGEILVTAEAGAAAGEIEDIRLGERREVELKGLPGRYTVIEVRWREALSGSGKLGGLLPAGRREPGLGDAEDAAVPELDHLRQDRHLQGHASVAGGALDRGPDQHRAVLAKPQLLDHRAPVGEDLVDVAHQAIAPRCGRGRRSRRGRRWPPRPPTRIRGHRGPPRHRRRAGGRQRMTRSRAQRANRPSRASLVRLPRAAQRIRILVGSAMNR